MSCWITHSRAWLGACSLLLASCSYETRESQTRRATAAPDDRTVVVTKKEANTQVVGVFSGHDYGTSHNFEYSFEIEPDGVVWEGYSSEPKALSFCPEQLYLRYLAHEAQALQPDAGSSDRVRVEIVARYSKHVDKRYLFKLLGKQYWLDIDEAEYSRASTCIEVALPNDNELKLE